MGGVTRWIWHHRNYVITLTVPLMFLPLPIICPTSEARCGYTLLVMVLYWCTECLPMAVTGMLPVVLFPMMGIMQAEQDFDIYNLNGSPEEDSTAEAESNFERLSKGISLSVCYSSTIGGMTTLTGTTANLILKRHVDKLFPGSNGIINFASWFGFAFPIMILMLPLSWLWLQFMFIGINFRRTFSCGSSNSREREAYAVIKEEYRKLGSMKFAEVAVLCVFVLLVVLWFTRDPGFIGGWATVLFNKNGPFVSDGTVAIFMSLLFFVIPSRLPRCGGYGCDDSGDPGTLLTWEIVHQHMPWDLLFICGGGYALATGSEVSGLSTWLGESLTPLKNIPAFAISFLLSALVATFTECSSNATTVTLFLPILASLAISIKLHPLYVMLPCTFAASLAFMLPVAQPPNAITFSYGNLKVMDMVKAGFMLNIIGILIINLAINTWGCVMFDMDTFPTWANVSQP
ncbi:solute carrier family 13 member 2-like [Corythoichthys intestinalis]|uniref:solute carrier family 13 member 2-like n=1 Tax=Corythoichthys intestinalis TaxID=161448 RepID=UPI0025A64AD2|nr:solute carrier family 13 member 2-like [Corythoichthys intestinalis]